MCRAGANIEATNENDDFTALHVATDEEESALALWKHCADVNVMDTGRGRPYTWQQGTRRATRGGDGRTFAKV